MSQRPQPCKETARHQVVAQGCLASRPTARPGAPPPPPPPLPWQMDGKDCAVEGGGDGSPAVDTTTSVCSPQLLVLLLVVDRGSARGPPSMSLCKMSRAEGVRVGRLGMELSTFPSSPPPSLVTAKNP